MQLLYHLVRSSEQVRISIFERNADTLNGKYGKDIVLARRLFAVMLDDLHMFLLPQMRLLENHPRNDLNDERITDMLSLVCYTTQVIVHLCRNKDGQIMMQTQMKIGRSAEEVDSDSISGVAILVDLLESTLNALVLDSFKSHLYSIINACIAFFYQLLAHNQEKVRVDGQRVQSFKLILSDAECIMSLQSCCKMIVNYHSQHSNDRQLEQTGISTKRAHIILQTLSE